MDKGVIKVFDLLDKFCR